MTDDSTTNSQSHTNKTLERRSIYDNDNHSVNNKSRKFRWSSCFSFITKFKKSKSQKIRLSQSYEEFVTTEYETVNSEPATIQGKIIIIKRLSSLVINFPHVSITSKT